MDSGSEGRRGEAAAVLGAHRLVVGRAVQLLQVQLPLARRVRPSFCRHVDGLFALCGAAGQAVVGRFASCGVAGLSDT